MRPASRLPGVAAALLTAGLAAAQGDKALAAQFRRLDADGDGVLVRKEFPGSDRQFAAIDKDQDGKATLAEYEASEVGKAFQRAAYRQQQEPRARTTAESLCLARLDHLLRDDRNKDGRVTRDEWTGTATAFVQLDLDGNGVLDKKDRAEALAAAPPPRPPLPETKSDLPDAAQLLKKYDKDGDGKLSAKEAAAHKYLLAALPYADSDHDELLSESELVMLARAVVARREAATGGRARPAPYEVPFDSWDQDKDGKVRQNEWQGPREIFEAIDLDHDSAVTRDELERYRRRATGDDFIARFDHNGDGKVTAAEFGGPIGAFHRADRNGDGAVGRADR